MKVMCCPYFEREIKKGIEPVGIKCKGATIRFPTKRARRSFAYPFCGSLKGYEDCPIYKFLSYEDENK